MAPMNLSPRHSNSVESLFLQSSHNLNDISWLKSDTSLPVSTNSSCSQVNNFNMDVQKSFCDLDSKSEVIQFWPKYPMRKAASSHARFEKIKKIRAFYEATFSSTESSLLTLSRSGPTLQNTWHSNSGDSSINCNSNQTYKWRKSNQHPINSNTGFLSKIEDELGPLRSKLNELSGQVKALNLIDIDVDFIDAGRSVFDKQATSCRHTPMEFQHSNRCLKYLHNPECILHNVTSSQYSQVNFKEINSTLNAFNDGNMNTNSNTSIHQENESVVINTPEIIMSNVTDNSKTSEVHQACHISSKIHMNEFQNYKQVGTSSTSTTRVNVAAQYDKSDLEENRENVLIPERLESKFLTLDPALPLELAEYNIEILEADVESDCTWNSDRKLPSTLSTKPKQTDQSHMIIGKQDRYFMYGMTSSPDEFYGPINDV